MGYAADEDHLSWDGTILFVEDKVFVREVTCEILRSAGYRILTAKNAVEAEQAYEQNNGEVDLLLTDVVLPGDRAHAGGEVEGEEPGAQSPAGEWIRRADGVSRRVA